MIENQLEAFEIRIPPELPRNFMVNHIAATFVETVRWWTENNMQESPELITKYFLLSIHSPGQFALVK